MWLTFKSTSDEKLLAQAAQGRESAFNEFYQRKVRLVYRFALEMSGSKLIAEEVTQDVFLNVARGSVVFDPDRGSVGSFLLGVARNYVLRAITRESDTVDLEDVEHCAAGGHDTLSNLLRNERADAVRKAVLSLPEAYREVVVLCDLEELSYAEAAEVVGCPVNTVRSRLARGRSLLEDKLQLVVKRCLV